MIEPSAPTHRGRHLRVFVSSTFRDMQAEREELVKRVFPPCAGCCEARGVVWGEVDLRWGITGGGGGGGQGVADLPGGDPACRPYFIGVLGERYGWVPREIPREPDRGEPWLAEHRERSVTELEILHGVLNDPDMAGHAFFYFRDPAYVGRLPADVAREEFRSESPEASAKLSALKERIRASGLPLREGYADPKAFGELVLADLGAVVDRLFPEGSQPDPLEREAREHEAFARSRAVVEVRPGEAAGVLHRPDGVLRAAGRARRGGRPAAGRSGRVGVRQIGAARQLGAGLPGPAPRRSAARALHRGNAGECRLDGDAAADPGGVEPHVQPGDRRSRTSRTPCGPRSRTPFTWRRRAGE